MERQSFLKTIAGLLFLVFFAIGLVLAARKPLWTDEIYTQTKNIDQASYFEIMAGKIIEGNNCPLFYLLQKGICDVFHYKFPKVWDSREREFSDPRSQFILRILPNFFTSWTLVMIFYFFSRYYSLSAGIYAFLVSLSSLMVWVYWVEARPYPLWIFFTVLQSMLFILLAKREGSEARWLVWLTVTNILLSLTVLFGIIQIMIVTGLLYAWGEKRLSKYFLMTIVPLGIAFFYYFRTLKIHFYLPDHPLSLIFVNLPLERVVVLLFYAVILGTLMVRQRGKSHVHYFKESLQYFILTIVMIAAALGILLVFKVYEPPLREGVFQLPHRYFLYLTPVMILAVTMCSIYIIKIFKGQRWMMINSIIFLGGILMIRILKTFSEVANQRLY